MSTKKRGCFVSYGRKSSKKNWCKSVEKITFQKNNISVLTPTTTQLHRPWDLRKEQKEVCDEDYDPCEHHETYRK